MTEYCATMESPSESAPKCVICLTEIVDMTLKQERSEWNWDEACVLKLFEIDPDSLDNFPSLTYFCQTCSLRNQKMWELCSQISLLQQSLQEMKLTLETDFKRGFNLERAHKMLDRTDFLRCQLAKSIKIIPPEQNYETTPVSSRCSPETSDFLIAIQKVDTILNDCPENISTPTHSNDGIITDNNSLIIPSESCEVTLEEPVNTGRSFPEPEPKERGRVRRRNVMKKSFEKAMPKAVKKEGVKLKDLRVKICIIPPDLLSNVPINVHTIPDYIPPVTIKSSRRATKSTLKVEQILEIESESDVEIVSDREWYYDEEYCDSENTRGTLINAVGNTGNMLARMKHVKGLNNDSHETQVLTENQEMQVLEMETTRQTTQLGNSPKRIRRRYPPGTKNRFYCTLLECARTQGFNSKEQLEVHHKKVHEGITHPFKCEECGKTFRLLTQLKVHHKNIHLGQFSFTCEFCGKGFSGRGNLQKHRVIHTDERNFKCTQCPMDFKTAHGRVLHVRYAHTGERPYTCDVCGKGFVSSTKLNNHLKCVHHREDRPIICHICGKNFPIQGYLYMHMRTHDNEAAAAAGLPIKKKPRWKKKSDPSTEEETVPIVVGNATFVEHGEEGTVYLLEPSSSDAEAIVLCEEVESPEKISIIDNSSLSTIIQSGEPRSKTLPLDLHLPVYSSQEELIRVQTLKGNSVTSSRLVGSQFLISNCDQTFPQHCLNVPHSSQHVHEK